MRQRSLLLAIATTLVGCGGGSGGGSSATAASVTSAPGPTPVTSSTTAGASSSAGSTPGAGRVAITPRGLRVDGRTRLLYGGEVQYFRIRDPQDDVARTHAMWADTLDRMVAAGMTLVTTYVPWDVHEPQEGVFDFSGVRDLRAFLGLCHDRGLLVIFKPGPFINSEWPYGLGSFGAVPEWFKTKFPGALARRPDGSPFTTDLLGRAHGRQPSFFAPELLTYTERYFQRLVPIIREFVDVRPTICGLQIDNETNFYFGDRYASDYSVHGVTQLQAFLRARYGTIAALNAAWGTQHTAFDQVQPPKARPKDDAKSSENIRHQDWFDAGHAGIQRFHADLRALWERLGVREPDVLFCTNDSPHTFIGRDLSLWRGSVKNVGGVAMLDAYPKQLPTSLGRPLDFPFLTSFFSKRFRQSNDAYAFAGGPPVAAGKCYAAELEGGLFSIPFVNIPLPVPVATTDHVLLQHVGRGSALAAVYVLREGLNRDGSPYFSNAGLARDGRPRDRWQVLERWGRFIAAQGDALLSSDEVEARVAVVVDERFDAPSGGVAGDPGKLQVDESAALFGLLEDAGLNPAVVDLSAAKPGDLDRYDVVWFQNPDVVHEDAARLLDAYVRGGGTLVNVGHPGTHDQAWRSGTITERLLARGLLSDGTVTGVFEDNLVAHGNLNLRVPGGPSGALTCGPFLVKHRLSGGATPLAWDRTFPFGVDGDVVAWSSTRGAGTVVNLGSSVARPYATARWYGFGQDDLVRARDLARWVAAGAGVGPLVSVKDAQGTAWARRVAGGPTFVFVQSRRAGGATLEVELHDLAALGLSAAQSYTVEDALNGRTLLTGGSIAGGVSVPLGAYGTAVLVIR